ncbi:MAG: heme o synthase [Thermoguttaceae bacterium]|jgi:protoheme IX farnesyltransferase
MAMFCKHYLQLAKIRVMAMVLATTAVGYLLASSRPIDWGVLGLAVLGTGLAAAGASALNQVLEIHRDAKMERTRRRPLPAGQISRGHALVFALVAAAAGVTVLNEWVNPLTAVLGLANLLVYVGIYTPLKPRTPLSTLVGAVCGAVPPVMGWTAAGRGLSLGAGLLATLLLLWQVPHFLSLVWLYREDYVRAGYRMLPVMDSTGRLTCLAIVLHSLALLPLGLAMMLFGMAGSLFGAASLALGLGFFLGAFRLHLSRTRQRARSVFLASLIYLPLVLAMLVADRQVGPACRAGLPQYPARQAGSTAPQIK